MCPGGTVSGRMVSGTMSSPALTLYTVLFGSQVSPPLLGPHFPSVDSARETSSCGMAIEPNE